MVDAACSTQHGHMPPLPPAEIDFYTFGSTNGHKVAIALEELQIPYEVHVVDVFAGEGQRPEFLALNPLGKIPVIRDRATNLVMTESDAILLYLADRAGALVPAAGRERSRAIELLFLQASFQGPMFGQRMYFSVFSSETVPFAIRRYEQQGSLVDRVVDRLLSGRAYFLGDEYSIVDIAFYGWYFSARTAGFPFDEHEHLAQWFHRVSSRPAVARGTRIPTPLPAFPARKRA